VFNFTVQLLAGTPGEGDVSANLFIFASGAPVPQSFATLKLLQAPDLVTANNFAVTTGKGAPVNVNVISNSNDSQGNSLTIESFTQPAEGAVTIFTPLTGSTELRYTPTPGFSGSDSFTYTVKNAQGLDATATVNLTVLSDPAPTISVSGQTVDKPASGFGFIQINIFRSGDLSADTTVEFSTADGTAVTGVDYFGNQSILDFQPGVTELTLNLFVLGGTPAAPDKLFTVNLANPSNGILANTSATEVIHDPNYISGSPVAVNDVVSANQNVPITIDVLANDFDPNNLPLSIVPSSLSTPAHGTIQIVHALDGHDEILYTPDSYFDGADSFTYAITNGNLTSSPTTVSINVTALTIQVFNGSNFYLELSADQSELQVWNGVPPTDAPTMLIPAASLQAVEFFMDSTAASVTYDDTNGTLPFQLELFNASVETVTFTNTTATSQLDVEPSTDVLDSMTLSQFGTQTVYLDSSGTAVKLGSLTVGSNVDLTPGKHLALVLGSLTINAGQLDLADGSMIVHNGVLSTIDAEIGDGYDNGKWDGGGIISSAAIGSFNTTLGIESNNVNGQILTSLFDGQSALISDILVRFTFYGDTDLSAAITAADYIQIDNAFNYNIAHLTTPMTGWYNGDFNYDGLINGDDYTLIDNAFNTQRSVSFAALPASLIADNTAQISRASTAAVSPEAEVRNTAAVANQPTGDNTDAQELKKRRPGAWEMLEA
jgi:hypothetical protein